LSVTLLIVAEPFSVNATVKPPLVRLLPEASFVCTVIVEVVTPSAATITGEVVMLDCVADGLFGVNVMSVVVAMGIEAIEPDTVTISATVFVKVAV